MKLKLQFRKYYFSLVFLTFYGVNAQISLGTGEKIHQKESLVIDQIPEDLPSSLSLEVHYSEELMTIKLEKCSVYGKNTRFLIDDGTGKLVEVEKPEECVYTGYVKEHPEYYTNAVIIEGSLIATIVRSKEELIEIRPVSKDKKKHQIFSVKNEHSHLEKGCMKPKESEEENFALPKITTQNEFVSLPISSNKQIFQKVNDSKLVANLSPTTVMDVLEYEIGVEIGSRAFFASTAYNGNLAAAQASAQSIIGNLNSRFLHGSGVSFKLGTVIIRTNVSTDPLRDLVTATGGSANASESLKAFKDYWNSNPGGEIGTTHDVAVYHVLSNPSGLAYVNKVATAYKYGTLGGNGPTSWANGTAVHEVGHIWNLRHTNSSGIFYENRPRNNLGSTSSGGNDYFISVMHGSGNHNIGRFSTAEAQVVRQVLNQKRSAGDLIANPDPVKPFGVYDEFEVQSDDPVIIDVISNDYDVNNDVLDVRVLDQVSNLGGTISLSPGTGPGGRNELIYTPPASGLNGRDFFHYTVFDTSGRTDFGAVYMYRETSLFNENSDEFLFDLGTRTSALWPDYDRVHGDTSNSLYGWTDTSVVVDRDRGSDSGTNNLNRDLCMSSEPATFETKVQNGNWEVLITFGDRSYAHDEIFVKAEGVDKLEHISTTPAVYFNRKFEVEVMDGKLSLEFSDRGGSDSNWVATRIILRYLGALSVEENSLEKVFSMYPNPVKSILNMEVKDRLNGDITIVNVLGSVMYSKAKAFANGKVKVDLDSWASGVYFLTFKRDNRKVVKRIIID
ncbi:T9SS type A sorting domain-containing protein [Tamlana fucoidanivorans]|uniref:T9SS type A sorting domain-containing protein n=1 Tax=Allotamlana fucoidanivorans TaxID=2583814 RepID=A0A5C4SIG1_9FLAO|nr:zinc-dependent metalloprotease [Tamlana fucoidanivorans]TNJ43112.1 T9SS type A sorting domain-containing protein [Tamlana fucoidanivorans]